MSYDKIDPNEMILRDHLAYDRTVMANERTVLAYVRTSMAFLAGGATMLNLFGEHWVLSALGALVVLSGIALGVFGVRRFVGNVRRLRRIYASDRRERGVRGSVRGR